MARARILSTLVLAAVATLLIAPTASAAPESLTINGITYTADDAAIGAGATATAYDGSQGTDVVIPATVNLGTVDYAVTTIGANAFQLKGMTSVAIPTTVTTILNFAFDQNALTSVTIPNSVTYLGYAPFSNNQIATLTVPNSVTFIGNSAFENNLLTSITLGNSVATIGDYAFTNNLLTSVTIPANVTTLGTSAFGTNPGLANVLFMGTQPTVGNTPLGATGSPGGPLVSYYLRNAGLDFSSPTWLAGLVPYRSQALATVTFDANGHGTAPAATDVVVGQSLANPGSLTAAGFTFNGWFAAASGGTAVTFPNAVAADKALYAQWSVASAQGGTGSGLAATGSEGTLPLGTLALLLVSTGAALVVRQRRTA